MKMVTVTTKVSIVVEGMVWEVEVSSEVEALTGEKFMDKIKKNIGWLFQQGFRPTGQPQIEKQVPENDPSSAPMPQQKAITDFIPKCPSCTDSPMRKSKTQKNEGKVMWFCTKAISVGNYCKERASTDVNTGEVNHWVVKK